MPRAKKDGKFVNFYMDACLLEELEKYCERTGLTKTTAIERFIAQGLEKDRKEEGNQD